MAKKQKPQSVLDIPVEFGGVSIGDATARIGIRLSRSRLNIDAADESLCGKRLTGRVLLCGDGDDPAQMQLFDAEYEVAGSFDVKRFGVSPKEITCGLTFAVESVNLSDLAHFAKRSGRLVIDVIDAIPDDSEEDDEDGEGDAEDDSAATRTRRGTKALFQPAGEGDAPQGDWRNWTIGVLGQFGLPPGKVKLLEQAFDDRLGKLIDSLQAAEEPGFWYRTVKGLGESGYDAMTEAITQLRAARPEFQSEQA